MNYFKLLESYDGINRMWICTKYQDIITDIEDINRKSKATSVEIFDFSTLYTNFDLASLKENIKWCMEKAFHGKDKKIAVYEDRAAFVSKPKEGTYA